MVNPFRVARPGFAALIAAGVFAVAGCDDGAARAPVSGAKVVTAVSGLPVVAPVIPKYDPLRPAIIGRLDKALIAECSGFVRSKKYPGVFWTFSDSGDTARIFAVDTTGATVPNAAGAKFSGIRVTGAKNTDWESITLDGSGRLIIGDFGNNLSNRRDLCLYVLPAEPDPARDTTTARARRVPFYYADQKAFPDRMKNHDGEAMFAVGDAVYVFTKEWSATGSVLHRVDMSAPENSPRPTKPVCRFESHGMVTDAAVSPDGTRLAILTYTCVWVFKLPAAGDGHPLSGSALYRPLTFPLNSWQVEAISFIDNESLLIGNEEADLYRVRLSDLAPTR